MRANPFVTVLALVVNFFVLLAAAMVVVTTVRFFGALSAHPIGQTVVELGSIITIPLGINLVKTPFGGVFDANAALTAGIFMLVEWLVSALRNRL